LLGWQFDRVGGLVEGDHMFGPVAAPDDDPVEPVDTLEAYQRGCEGLDLQYRCACAVRDERG